MASEPNTWPPASAHRKMTPASIQTLYAIVWQGSDDKWQISFDCVFENKLAAELRASVDRETYPHLKHSVATVKFAEVAK